MTSLCSLVVHRDRLGSKVISSIRPAFTTGFLPLDASSKFSVGFHPSSFGVFFSQVVGSCGEAIVTIFNALWIVKYNLSASAILCLNRGGNECGSDCKGNSAKHHCFVVDFVVVVFIINNKNSSPYILISFLLTNVRITK